MKRLNCAINPPNAALWSRNHQVRTPGRLMGDGVRTLNLYFVIAPSYTLFIEILSNTIVKGVADRM